MVRTNAPLIERMTLIWHSWFATSNQGVASQQLMLNQNDLFRGNALGSFADLLIGRHQDPAMLIWLNGNQNVKGHPNENYGREMMELFTLGADRGAYTETDVREQARALTGWTGSVNKGVHRQLRLQPEPARHRRTRRSSARRGNYAWQDSCQPLPQPSAAPVVTSSTSSGATSSRRRPTRRPRRARGALHDDRLQGAPGRRGDPPAPGLLLEPAHGQAAGRLNAGLLRMTRPLHRHRGLVDAQRAGRASSSSTRRTSAAGTTRAGSTPRPCAPAGSSPRSCRARRRRPTARATRRSSSTARSSSGATRRSRRRRSAARRRSRRRS